MRVFVRLRRRRERLDGRVDRRRPKNKIKFTQPPLVYKKSVMEVALEWVRAAVRRADECVKAL